jgi:hypothetical protein
MSLRLCHLCIAIIASLTYICLFNYYRIYTISCTSYNCTTLSVRAIAAFTNAPS